MLTAGARVEGGATISGRAPDGCPRDDEHGHRRHHRHARSDENGAARPPTADPDRLGEPSPALERADPRIGLDRSPVGRGLAHREPGVGHGGGQLRRQRSGRRPGGGVLGRGLVGQPPQRPGLDAHGEPTEKVPEPGHVVDGVELLDRARRDLAGVAALVEPAQHRPPVGAHQDVVGVDGAVDDAEVVEVGEGRRQRRRQPGQLPGGERAERGQGRSVDRRGDQDGALGRALDIHELHHAGVAGRRQQARLRGAPRRRPTTTRSMVRTALSKYITLFHTHNRPFRLPARSRCGESRERSGVGGGRPRHGRGPPAGAGFAGRARGRPAGCGLRRARGHGRRGVAPAPSRSSPGARRRRGPPGAGGDRPADAVERRVVLRHLRPDGVGVPA